MPRAATGTVVVDKRRKSPSYALKFHALGRRQHVTLGTAEQGWTPGKAQAELQVILAEVRCDKWEPTRRPEPEPAPRADADPTFHEYASAWFEANEGEWRERTRTDYAWALTDHLLPHFAGHRLSQITIAEVDAYRAAKVRDGRLAPASINKTITRLSQILELAAEHGLIERNPARGRRRRLKPNRPAPVWLDSAEHIAALLDAAGELDRERGGGTPRRAILSTLALAGLRIGELIELRWADVDLATGRLTIRAAKTDAGRRVIDLLPALRDELAALKAGASVNSAARVFPTASGGPMNPSNIRNRILTPAVERANERLEAGGSTPLPDGLSPHKLRHTFASVLVALGTDAGAVMDQLGHKSAGFTFSTYRHGMRRDERSRLQLAELAGAEPAVKSPRKVRTSGFHAEHQAGEGNGHAAKMAY